MPRTYPESEPAWVEKDGDRELRWLDEAGKPAEAIGVEREHDVPGIHTPPALAKIHATSVEAQIGRLWPILKTAEAHAKAPKNA